MRVLYALGLAHLVFCLGLVAASDRSPATPVHAQAAAKSPPLAWFREIKPFCNPVEVEVAMRRTPPPAGGDGTAYQAACYALAGRIDSADTAIRGLPERDRARAAGVVFGIGHPVADSGDDVSSAPIMRLVIGYQPDNYMALYHAGISEFTLGDYERARPHLERFLELYDANDGWTSRAESALARLREREGS